MSAVAQELSEEGRREGRQEGQQEGMAKLTLVLRQQRFGRISAALRKRIEGLSSEKLQELGLALFDVRSKKDLPDWLASSNRAH